MKTCERYWIDEVNCEAPATTKLVEPDGLEVTAYVCDEHVPVARYYGFTLLVPFDR